MFNNIGQGGFLHGDTLKARLLRKLPVRTHLYEVCPTGCKLYNADDNDTECKFCKKPRVETNPKQQMFSVGDQFARLLAVDDFREKLAYRSEFVKEEGVYEDYYSGKDYEELVEEGIIDKTSDICVSFGIDGFRSSKRKGSNLTMVNLVNLSIPPAERYVPLSIYH